MSSFAPVITVGMPVYNGEKYISQAIDSILSQTFDDFSLIISDNYSTDNTEEICREYANKDPRIIYIKQEKNLGAPLNWNFVFNQCKGQYFKWASSNDVCHPQFLEKCKEILDKRNNVILCYSKTKLIDAFGNTIDEYKNVIDLQDPRACNRFQTVLTRMDLNNAQGGLIRSDVLAKTALEGIYQHGDVQLMAELSLHGKFCEIQDYLFLRRVTPETITHQRSRLENRIFNNPEFKGWLYLPEVKLHLGLFAVVYRSPIKNYEKLKLFIFLLRFAYWRKKQIFKELKC
jgi:glycosyltransferase involved in cell wall biosynthesis